MIVTLDDTEVRVSRVIEFLYEIQKNGLCASHIIDQLRHQILTLQDGFRTCMKMNDDVIATNSLLKAMPQFDPETGTFYNVKDGERVVVFKVTAADGGLPTIRGSTTTVTFMPGKIDSSSSSSEKELQMNLAKVVEDFYYRASRTWDILEKELVGKKNSKFIGVKDVRSNLFEHPNAGELHSFSATTDGPKVKSMWHTNNKPKTEDKGLGPNYLEFLELVEARLKGLILGQTLN